MDASKEAGFARRFTPPVLMAAGVLFARLMGLLSLPMEGLRGYGDFIHYYLVSGLKGWPFINSWAEYPPIFPFFTVVLNHLSGGQEHIFTYLLEFLLLLADTGSMFLFARLVERIFPPDRALVRAGAYLLVLVALPYSWWYFDPLPVFFLLLGLSLVLERKVLRAGAALCIGVGLKFFPGLALLAAWRRVSWQRLALLAAISVIPVILSYAVLWRISPEFTRSSLFSQGSKGSWESAWALIDGNLRTGDFGPLDDRLDPAAAFARHGNPAVIPPAASLVIFAGLGLWGLSRFRPVADEDPGSSRRSERQSIALVGFAWSLFVLWSPGWSPQWVLYLLPLILLALPLRRAFLLSVALIMVNLLEWPVLLSRGYFWGLWVTIPLRTLVLLILAGAFYTGMREAAQTAGQKDRAAADGLGMV